MRHLVKVAKPGLLETYVAGLALAAVAAGLGLASTGTPLGNPWVVGCLAAVAAIGERGSVKLPGGIEVSISLLPTLFAAATFGPLAAMVVAAASMLADVHAVNERPYLRWLAYTSSRVLTGAAAGLAALAMQELIPNALGGIAAATVAGALVAESLDVYFAAVINRLRGRGTVADLIRSMAPLAFLAVPIYVPVVALLVVAYEALSPWTLLLFAAPTLAAHRLYGLYETQRRLAEESISSNKRLERANLSFATALVTTLDARDQYTAGHSAAVAIYSRDIAARLALTRAEQQLAYVCGLVHDIGKIGLPAGLLEKAGPLNPEERRHMEEHSAIGERILEKVEDFKVVAKVVRHHHERLDGQGYPDGLVKAEIPLIARIIAVADAYNAMTSDRPYRDAMPSVSAQDRLIHSAGYQFDTHVVDVFIELLREAGETYKSGRREDFSLANQKSMRGVRLPAVA